MAWTDIFTGGIVKSIENIASEWITTDMESAEAKAVMVKAIDPNGKMRRDLSRFASRAYAFYLAAMVIMGFMHVFGVGNPDAAKEAMGFLSELFLPITASWGAIVTASFGVNATNSIKGRP
ncbi:MAG: hypothetical protein O7D95_03105 [Betaproteobacteria bacterium]|nr:hypothetical protein [Betaproteobacteria bacterium]